MKNMNHTNDESNREVINKILIRWVILVGVLPRPNIRTIMVWLGFNQITFTHDKAKICAAGGCVGSVNHLITCDF